MSDENLWGDDESIVDMPDEAQLDSNGQYKVSPPVQLPRPKAPVAPPPVVQAPVEEDYSDVDFGMAGGPDLDADEEDYSSVLNDANLRLEQGSLYKLIMKHDLFAGVDSDPVAIQNVQKAIRKFAREQMEIMLGMRKETNTVEHLEINFPFNAVEVDVLKKLAFAATKGASENSDAYVPEVKRTTSEVEQVPKRHALNPIGGSPHPKKTYPPQKKAAPTKPLQSKASTPVKRSRMDLTIDQIAREEGIPRELLEEEFYLAQKKPVNEMTEQEIAERNNIIKQRRTTQVRSSAAIPMATPEQQEMLAIARANQISQGPSVVSRTPGITMAHILDAVKKMPVKE